MINKAIKNYIKILLTYFLLLVGCAYSKGFTFTADEPQWNFYGEGLGTYVNTTGRGVDRQSIWLSTDYGENETAYFTWKDLSPGLYKITSYVRAQDVQKGSEGASFWHFYDGGNGVESIFSDLNGSYNWRKIEFVAEVKGVDLTVWFRLKSSGQVWIDDFTIEKIKDGKKQIVIEPGSPLPASFEKKIDQKTKLKLRKTLYSFDSNEAGHPFSIKNKMGELSPQKFFNFQIKNMPIKDWSPYDRVEMAVFNPNDNFTDFYLTIADDKSMNYWSQLNHKQTLAPGWNYLSFSLDQYLGERGSHRFLRSLNLSRIEKVFVVIDPDSKSTYKSTNFLVDNIYLSSNPMPEVPDSVMAFDFTSQKAKMGSNLKRVTTQTLYNNERGYGFVDPIFWRVEDSQYASEALRYSIGALSGKFRIKLPNGKYQMSLVIDKLGYWDAPFWSDRTVLANGLPIFKESRSSGKDFLQDLLKFETIRPEVQDNPYDLYLSKIFHTIDKTVDVDKGFLDIEFYGDESGINLNTLMLWNKNNEASGLSYKKSFEQRNKEEFNWMSRSIQNNEKKLPNISDKLSISIIEPDLYLNPKRLKEISRIQLQFLGGTGENPYQLVQLNPGNRDEKISWNLSDFISAEGEKISSKQIELSDLIFQYTSPDINHETYTLTGKYLRPLEDHSYKLQKNLTKYLWMQLRITNKVPKGIFKGALTFYCNNEVRVFPVEITVLDYNLPRVEFPVGFFGLDPLPYTYYKGLDYNKLRKKYRHQALNLLGEAGFTTFTGLPSDISDLDDLFLESSKWGIETVYSYGGQFPQSLIDGNSKPAGMTDEAYFKKNAQELKSLLSKKNWPKIVHTFSDEAGGYSDRIATDIEIAQKLKKYFPFMALGGFGSFHGGESNKLNALFDYGFFSSLSRNDISSLKNNNQRWGFYNASAGNLDDPRFTFGPGLYIARLNGLSQYLEWHATAVNNYPYYDFDGRESDAVMFYPTSDGKLFRSLRFELATEGLHAYKKLKVLESVVASAPNEYKEAKEWLLKLSRENFFYSSKNFLSNRNFIFKSFNDSLDGQLKNIFLKKSLKKLRANEIGVAIPKV